MSAPSQVPDERSVVMGSTSVTGPAGPAGLGELFWAFTVLSLQGFGGVMAVVHRELVEKRRWLAESEFLEDWAVAQVMPGPNVCNLALVFGDRHLGWAGALAALTGLLAAPLLMLLLLASLLHQWGEWLPLNSVLRGMGAVAAGLIAGSALKLVQGLRHHVLGPALLGLFVAAAFLATVVIGLPLHATVLGIGGVACALTWWLLKRQRAA